MHGGFLSWPKNCADAISLDKNCARLREKRNVENCLARSRTVSRDFCKVEAPFLPSYEGFAGERAFTDWPFRTYSFLFVQRTLLFHPSTLAEILGKGYIETKITYRSMTARGLCPANLNIDRKTNCWMGMR